MAVASVEQTLTKMCFEEETKKKHLAIVVPCVNTHPHKRLRAFMQATCY